MLPQAPPDFDLLVITRALWEPHVVELGCWPACLVINEFLPTLPLEFILIDFYFLGFWTNHPLGMREKNM